METLLPVFGALIRSGTFLIFGTCNGAKLHFMHTAGYADQRQGGSNEGWRWTGRGRIGMGKGGRGEEGVVNE